MPNTAHLQQLARTVPATIPKLESPFPAQIHPLAAEVQQQTTKWVLEQGLLSEARRKAFLDYNYTLLIARCYPYASVERLQIISDWNAWLFELDDQCDEARIGHDPQALARLHQRLGAVIRGATVAADEPLLVTALADIMGRMRALAPLAWFEVFTQQVDDYFIGNQWEAHNRLYSIIPSEIEYLHYRKFTSAVAIYIAFIEFMNASYLTADERQSIDLRNLQNWTNLVLSLCNDLVSVKKELRQGDWHNYGAIVALKRGMSIPEALEIVANEHNHCIQQFITTTTQLKNCSVALQKVLNGMMTLMRGNYDWSDITSRYATKLTELSYAA
ncbi:MAG TPA: hypothetical protein DEF47_19990 [Herpetosiphon sp.]|uniref:Terpene synthase n=1 Tax=Herpetosiphon aurantiacus (strain ATCC 23779 / DSM 785 / 114-95) TaxID=316274 RepID=A9B3Q4_HERA2|nr:terpene synthase metal-binding domain-containing protein [Herpetosiphon sp.]ABX05626.1 Terpene synthase metal-binding domain protein [Herpetosiphon aurantiacus DSM 785]BAP82245.1 terpene synthase [synthetic construct]HBW52175.1 hypothetical protein [Herpetosiphon sp.]